MASIAVSAAATIAVIILSFYVITGPVTDQRHLIGAGLGFLLGVLMTGQVVVRVTERQIATEQVRARQERIRRERALNTGTWLGDQPGQELTVRWDAEMRRYLIRGWISRRTTVDSEREWSASLDDLATMLTEIEASGDLGPIDDAGTRSVRARLALPGWDDVPEPDPVATQPTGTEPAHLQRLALPVTRRYEYDGPTCNLTGPARRARNTWGDRP